MLHPHGFEHVANAQCVHKSLAFVYCTSPSNYFRFASCSIPEVTRSRTVSCGLRCYLGLSKAARGLLGVSWRRLRGLGGFSWGPGPAGGGGREAKLIENNKMFFGGFRAPSQAILDALTARGEGGVQTPGKRGFVRANSINRLRPEGWWDSTHNP